MNLPWRKASSVVLTAAALLLPACGGSGNGGGPTGGTPPPTGGAGSDACAAALASADLGTSTTPAQGATKSHGTLGRDVRDVRDVLWTHRTAAGRTARALDARDLLDEDVGDIAVVQDDGTLILGANPFDLSRTGLRFTRNGAGGYDVALADATLRAPLGAALALGDDDTSRAGLPFAFSFYGRSHDAVFVNSDGNLTFEEGDNASTERGIGRLLAGPPRVAPFFADLDPTTGGRVFVSATAGAFTVTWCSVRGFDSTDLVTTQTSLLPDGSVEVRFGNATLPAAITALSPGRTDSFAAVDLRGAPSGNPPGAVGERFAANAELDLVTAARRFLSSHADAFDQIAFWTDTRVVESGTFAFQTTVNSQIRGIGKDLLNASGQFGSGGRLQGLIVMDDLGKYPEDPNTRVVGEDSSVSVFAHEVGHRWLARLRFRDAGGRNSEALLGRQSAHWSFFFDSDGSVMEGNEIEDLGGGQFRTGAPSQRYGPLDLYAMGLIGPGEVPPVFFVENPTGTTRSNESDPRSGVTFGGTRREVRIDQIQQALGPREPPADASPRVHNLAVVYVTGRGRTASPAALAKLERIRQAFVPFFASATGGRMEIDTRLR